MLYGTAVKEFNNVSDIVRMFISDYFKGINSFDYLETYKQITKEYAKQILNNVFKEENTIISVVEPKDKEKYFIKIEVKMNTITFPGLNLIFNISRIAFSINSIHIYWYAILIVLAIIIGIIIFKINDRKV